MELQLWLAIALAQREIVDLLPPRYMTQQYFNTLKAGSEVVTMRQQSPYIFENVSKISEFMAADENEKQAIRLY